MPAHNKSFANAGWDIETSAMCRYQQRFGLDIQFSALVPNFNFPFSNWQWFREGQAMNSLPSEILERCTQAMSLYRREIS
jgi:hypothetical protein